MRPSPNAEMQALQNAREKARHKMILIGLGMAIVAVAILAELGREMFLVYSDGRDTTPIGLLNRSLAFKVTKLLRF